MRSLLSNCLLGSISAALYGLAFPTVGWTALSWISLVPLFVAIRSASLRGALFIAWLWCVVGACVAGSWFPRAVAGYFHQSTLVALSLFVVVFTFMAGPYLIAFAAAYRVICRANLVAVPFLAAAAWVAAEFGRGRLMTESALFIGNPWGLIGYAHVDEPALIQLASITGIYGISYVIVCTNAALAELWFSLARSRRLEARAVAALSLACVPVMATLVFGAWVLAADRDSGPASERTMIAIVQANESTGTRWRSDLYGRNLDTYLRLTVDAVESARSAGEVVPRVVFWPEAAMTFFLEDERQYQAAIARVLSSRGLELVAGGPRRVGDTDPAYFNSVYSLSSQGEITGRYDKQHLVPFAEYFPVGIDILRREFGRVRLFQHGREVAPLTTSAGAAGVVICNEAMLPEVAGSRVRDGAEFLFNPSNDTWITDPQYTEQQFDIARVRAVEQRRFLVRASTAGPSALIDPWGRVVSATRPLEQGVVVGEIWPSSSPSVYGRVGDLFALACVFVSGCAIWRLRR